MRQDRFRHLLDAYGADLDRWPDADRDDAVRYRDTSEAARIALADAARLDAALIGSTVELSDAALDALVAKAAARVASLPAASRARSQSHARRSLVASVLVPALAVCCFAFGIVMGARLGTPTYVVLHDQFANHPLLADPVP